MATQIEVASNALVRIGENPISSFSEGGAAGIAANNLYEVTVRALLSEHSWNFTRAKRTLARLTATPLNYWQYAFQLPSDLLRLERVFPQQDYQIFEDKLYCNSDTLSIDYQFRAPEAGWPEYFQLVAEYRLAAEFALIVTSNEEQNAIYENKYAAYLKRAKNIDSQQAPMESWVSVPYRDVRA